MLAILKTPIKKSIEEIEVEAGVLGVVYFRHHALFFKPIFQGNSNTSYSIAESQITKIPTPLRIGKKRKRVILDNRGHEVVQFREGLEALAKLTCDLINNYATNQI